MKERQEERLSLLPKIGERFREWFEALSYGKRGLGKMRTAGFHPAKEKKLILKKVFMKIFKKNIPADKIGNFILTVITAFVSTFFMQSCCLC